jgi:hypothetical protein
LQAAVAVIIKTAAAVVLVVIDHQSLVSHLAAVHLQNQR